MNETNAVLSDPDAPRTISFQRAAKETRFGPPPDWQQGSTFSSLVETRSTIDFFEELFGRATGIRAPAGRDRPERAIRVRYDTQRIELELLDTYHRKGAARARPWTQYVLTI